MADHHEVVMIRDLHAEVPRPNMDPLVTVNGVNLTLLSGRSYAVVGPSGSGKTSLVSIVGLLNTHYSGSFHFLGRNVSSLSDTARARLRAESIGFVFQNYSLISHYRVWENVALPLLFRHGRFPRNSRSRAEHVLDSLGLAHRADERPDRLSGGEQQRVAIARAIIADPPLIICDEPTGALDTDTGAVVLKQLLSTVAIRTATLLVVTHSPDVAHECDEVLTMDRGRFI